MTLNLAEHTIDLQDVIKNIIEGHQRHIKLFFIEKGWMYHLSNASEASYELCTYGV